MKNIFLFTFSMIFIFCNCRTNSTNPDPVDNGLLWTYTMEPIINDTAAAIHNPIIYEDIVVIPKKGYDDHKAELIALNKITGEFMWSWSEAFDKYEKDGFSNISHVHDGVLAIGDNNYTAAIDIYTGETLWDDLDNVYGLTAITGVNDVIFKTAYIPREKYWVQKGNIYSGEWETIYELDKEEDYFLGSYTPTAYEWNGKTYITFHKIDWRQEPIYESNNYLHLFNVTDNKLAWKTDTIPLDFPASHTPGVIPVFENGQILIANGVIYSYNLTDGELRWKKSYGNSFSLSSNIAAKDGKVYGNNADGYMVSLDVKTGEEFFNAPTGFAPSRVQVNDNMCYLSGVSDGDNKNLMVIDAQNGQILKSILPPFINNYDDNYSQLQRKLTIDPETGYAYTADFKNFICFDFE